MPVPPHQPLRYGSSQALLDAHLQRLQRRYGMALWMITRVRESSMWLLRVTDHHYGLEPGHRIEWERSYCMDMAREGGPSIVPDTRKEPVYQSAGINNDLSIGAYVGLPLMDSSNQLFGTLCALDPMAQPDSLKAQFEDLQHDAAIISYTLEHAVHHAQQQRLTTFIEHPDRCDETGLPGRNGWKDIFRQEQRNCLELGMQSTAIYLQAAEDANSLTIADSLAALLREQDSVAHLGDNRFGILLADTDQDKADIVANRIRDALNAKRMLVRLQREYLAPPGPG